MNLLALNMEVSQRVHTAVKVKLCLLPYGLMFAAFIPLFFFSSWLSSVLGIPEGSAVREQENGLLFICILLGLMVLLMIASYFFGWILNALIWLTVLKWPQQKVGRAFFYSELPPSWIGSKDSGAFTSHTV